MAQRTFARPFTAAAFLSLIIAVPAQAWLSQAITVETPEERAAREKLDRTFCRKVQAVKGHADKVAALLKTDQSRLNYNIGLIERGEKGCKRDPDLALSVKERLLAGQSLLTADIDLASSLRLGLIQRGRPEDLARAAEIEHYLWVRGSSPRQSNQPAWGLGERLAFLNRDDVWAYISQEEVYLYSEGDLRIEPWLDQSSPRFDPDLAVRELLKSGSPPSQLLAANVLREGKLLPADPARAEELLWAAAERLPEALRGLVEVLEPRLAGPINQERSMIRFRLLDLAQKMSGGMDAPLQDAITRALLPDLANPIPFAQRRTAYYLASHFGSSVTTVDGPVTAWAEAILLKPNHPDITDAVTILARLIASGSTAARQVLDRDIARHGGLADAGSFAQDPTLTALGSNPVHLLLSDDYPVRALREGKEAVVESWAVMSPYGWAAMVEVAPGTPEPFASIVRQTLTRRMRWKTSRWPGRYVRVKLPLFQFRVRPVDGTAVTPAIPGAVVIDAVPPPQPRFF